MFRKVLVLAVVASLMPFSSSYFEIEVPSLGYTPINYYQNFPEDTLLLVHAIFQHGEKTPESFETYPNDPHQSQLYYPYGFGQLIERGKTRMYNLGQFLRNRYKNLLGSFVEPESIKAKTAEEPVSEMSLRVLLAALIPWQANIPYEKLTPNTEMIFKSLHVCPDTKFFQNQMQQEDLKRIYYRFWPLLSYITTMTSSSKGDLDFAKTLYKTLKSQENFGLELPSWTKNVYPNALKEAAAVRTKMNTWNFGLKKIATGYFFNNIINDSVDRINGKTNLKMSLYSGHSHNLAAILDVLGVFDPPYIPSYGSCLLFELWKKSDGTVGVKIFHKDDENNKSGYINSSNYGNFYPLHVFNGVIKRFIPTTDTCRVFMVGV